MVGPPKIGKSWLELAISLAVASGGKALGHINVGQPRPVLLLALEDGHRRLQDRVRKLIPGEPIPPLLNVMISIPCEGVVATVEAWLAEVDHPAPLVFLDTLGKVMPPTRNGESPYQRDYKVAGALKGICDRRPGMSLTALHHDRKAGSEDFVEVVSGTNGIAGAADTIIVMTRPRNEAQGLLKVTGRDVVEGEYAVTMDGGIWELIGSTLDEAAQAAATVRATANLSDRSAEILRDVSEHPEGVKPADIAREFDIPPKEAAVYLGRLLEARKVRRPERGLYTPVVSVVSVVTDDFENPEDNTYNGYNNPSRACEVCGFALPSSVIADGFTTHPTCGGDA